MNAKISVKGALTCFCRQEYWKRDASKDKLYSFPVTNLDGSEDLESYKDIAMCDERISFISSFGFGMLIS